MYPDGAMAEGSHQILEAGEATYDYEWTDTPAGPGPHTYVLRVGDCLIASPVYLGSATRSPRLGTPIRA